MKRHCNSGINNVERRDVMNHWTPPRRGPYPIPQNSSYLNGIGLHRVPTLVWHITNKTCDIRQYFGALENSGRDTQGPYNCDSTHGVASREPTIATLHFC